MGAPDKVSETAKTIVELAISGMTCSGCSSAVERVLSRSPGVSQVRVELVSGRAWVYGSAPAAQLVEAVQAAGYGAQWVPHSESQGSAGAATG